MFKKLVLIILIALIALIVSLEVYAQGGAAGAGMPKVSILSKIWKKLTSNPFAFTLILLSLTTVVSTVVTLLRKDKCLKNFKGCLVNLELRDNSRFRGRLRVENTGLELLSEKSRVVGKGARASYLLPDNEYNKIHALIRYHDRMTDKERRVRDRELEKIYHPRMLTRMHRKIKNFTNSIKDALKEAFNITLGKIKGKAVSQQEQEKYLKQAGETMISYTAETTYDPLIEQLIGTKVLAQVSGTEKTYIGVLKDYTKDFVQIMDIDYTYHWHVKMKIPDEASKVDWGLHFQRRQNSLIISSDNPYEIKITDILYSEDQPDFKWAKVNKIIEPYGEINVELPTASVKKAVEPFKDLQVVVSLPYDRYKSLTIFFETVRRADVVFPRSGYVYVRHRTEKFTPKLFQFGLLGNQLLGQGDTAAVSDKHGKLSSTMHSYHGYLTNLQKERIELHHVAMIYSRRWGVWSSFDELYEKFRSHGRFNGKFNGNLNGRKLNGNHLSSWSRKKILIAIMTLICSQPKFNDANYAKLLSFAFLSF